MADEDPVIVFEGTQAAAEALHAMLTARGVTSSVTRDREVEGGTRLTVVESGFDGIPLARRASAFEANEGGWAEQLENIGRHVSA